MQMLFMGIDVGTQGVRCVISNAKGNLCAAKSIAFKSINISKTEGWYEQSPADWQAAMEGAIIDCIAQLKKAGFTPENIRAISIDGTSGTIVPLDREYHPLTNGIMYNDPRAKVQAARTHAVMGAHEKKLGLKFGNSFSLPRILWILECQPEVYEKTRVFAHEADYMAGVLCGEYTISDYSNALKTGYDLVDGCWPIEISRDLGIDITKLPRIGRPGAPLAPVSSQAAKRLGLSTQTMIVGGSTDGYASALAAGAVRAGSWASIIGTTYVLKGVTEKLVIDPNGSSYSHMLPAGEWLLGGASNLGGRALNECAAGRNFDELNVASEGLIPTGVRCYPLTGRGERFPFVHPNCEPFYIGDIWNGKLYPAVMEGVGFAERLSVDHMIKLGCTISDVIYTTGGACRSDLWLKIRASILNRQLKVPAVVDAAMGSAMLAAADQMGGLDRSASEMIHYVKTVDPDKSLVEPYADIYARFLDDVYRLYNVEV